MIKYKNKDVDIVDWLSKEHGILQVEIVSKGDDKGQRLSCKESDLTGPNLKSEMKRLK